jgi:hypothetical protein
MRSAMLNDTPDSASILTQGGPGERRIPTLPRLEAADGYFYGLRVQAWKTAPPSDQVDGHGGDRFGSAVWASWPHEWLAAAVRTRGSCRGTWRVRETRSPKKRATSSAEKRGSRELGESQPEKAQKARCVS